MVVLVVLLLVILDVAVVAAAVNANVSMMIVILLVLVLGDDVRILSVLRRVGHNDTNQTYINDSFQTLEYRILFAINLYSILVPRPCPKRHFTSQEYLGRLILARSQKVGFRLPLYCLINVFDFAL